MTRRCDFPVFDADNHLYETEDAFTRHLPDAVQAAPSTTSRSGAGRRSSCAAPISEYIPNPTFEVVARPGAQEEYFRIGNPEGKSFRELIGEPMKCIPAFREPGPRLELMDELGVDRTLMFPTLASLLEERMRDDPELIHAVIHSLNEWLYEQWTFNYEDRIFTTPVITLPIVDKAHRGARVGARAGRQDRPHPPGAGARASAARARSASRSSTRSGKPCVDADILVSMHASDSGYARYQSDWTGPQEMLPFKLDPFRLMTQRQARRSRTRWRRSSATACSRRFPDLRIASIENGGDWVVPFLAPPRRRLPQDAAGVRRGSGRGVQAQRLGQPVPRGRHRRR